MMSPETVAAASTTVRYIQLVPCWVKGLVQTRRRVSFPLATVPPNWLDPQNRLMTAPVAPPIVATALPPTCMTDSGMPLDELHGENPQPLSFAVTLTM